MLDSARGTTADYVHAIRGSRKLGSHDQYWGIQADANREYIAYTRGKYVCNMGFEVQPVGHPGQPAAKFKLKGRDPETSVAGAGSTVAGTARNLRPDPDRRAISKLVADVPGWLRLVVSVIGFR